MEKREEKKKSILKKWWFWVIIIFIIVIISSSNSNTINNSTNISNVNNNNNNNTVTETTNKKLTSLKNSNGKEFFEILCEVGEVEKTEGVNSDDYIIYSSSNEKYGIELQTNLSNEITSISIYTLLKNKNDYQNFFNAIARLEYENSDRAQCFNWINDNLEKEASTKIGDANFKLYTNSSGNPALDIFI